MKMTKKEKKAYRAFRKSICELGYNHRPHTSLLIETVRARIHPHRIKDLIEVILKQESLI